MTHNDYIDRLLGVPVRQGTRNRKFHNEHAEVQAMRIVSEAYRDLPAAQWAVLAGWIKSHFGLSDGQIREWAGMIA